MATPRSRKPEPAGVESETVIVEAAEPLATPFAGLGKASGKPLEDAAPTPFVALRETAPLRKPVEGHELALGQMRLVIEEGC
jgi:hypothetical protein